MRRDLPQDIRIPGDERPFCGDGRAEAVSIQQLQRVARQLQLLFKRIVRVAHGACGHHAALRLGAKVVPYDGQRVRFYAHGIKILHAVTLAAAVAVKTAVAAAPVNIHRIPGAEPGGAFVFDDNAPGRDGRHIHKRPPF